MNDRRIPLGLQQLAYSRRSGSTVILPVLRYTPTQVVCRSGSDEIRFNLENGNERGGGYGSRAFPVSESVLESISRDRLDSGIRGLAYKLEELSRKLAHKDRRTMAVQSLEDHIARLRIAVLAVERMLADE